MQSSSSGCHACLVCDASSRALFASSACGPCLLALVLLRVPAWTLSLCILWTLYICSPSGLCATLAAMANARDVISIYLSPAPGFSFWHPAASQARELRTEGSRWGLGVLPFLSRIRFRSSQAMWTVLVRGSRRQFSQASCPTSAGWADAGLSFMMMLRHHLDVITI